MSLNACKTSLTVMMMMIMMMMTCYLVPDLVNDGI